jgi:hypothetical protein
MRSRAFITYKLYRARARARRRALAAATVVRYRGDARAPTIWTM